MPTDRAPQSYVARLRAMADELADHPELTVTECSFADGATEQQLAAAGEKLALSDAMQRFYGEANGVRIAWERSAGMHTEAGDVIAGTINLLAIEEVLSDWVNIVYGSGDDAFADLHPLDMFTSEACAALCLDGSDPPELYYHYLGESSHSLGVDFEGYLELLLTSRGFWYWQTAVRGPARSRVARTFRTVAPSLFADIDLDDFM